MTKIIDEKNIEIGKRLKNLREENNLKQEQVLNIMAEKDIYLSERTLRRYESGESGCPLSILVEFLNIYHSTLDYAVLGHNATNDNSFSWHDMLIRFNRLLFSMALYPVKYGTNDETHYFFVSFDDEMNLLVDKVMTLCKNENYNFDHEKSAPLAVLQKMDNLISDIVDTNDEILIDEKRLKKIGENLNIDMLKAVANTIEKAREIAAKNKK